MTDKKPLLTNKKATANTPQIVTLLVDDSNSMCELAEDNGKKTKAQIASESIEDMIISAQSQNLGSKGFRFLFNVAKFGDHVTPLIEAGMPGDVDLETLKFAGDSGWTHMAEALEWGAAALGKALQRCRALPSFDEQNSPPPIVLLLSDGGNTGPEIDEPARLLRSIAFAGGPVSVIACGIGMKAEHFATMTAIASDSELALNIRPSQLAEFLAAVAATIQVPVVDHLSKFKGTKDGWDGHMAVAREALRSAQLAEAQKALEAAWGEVRDAGDGRETSTLSALAKLHAMRGDWASALPHAQQSISLLDQLGPSNSEKEVLESGASVAALLTLAEKQPEADQLWMRLHGLLSTRRTEGVSPATATLIEGFASKATGEINKAKAALEQALSARGEGKAAALRGLADLSRKVEGRKAAEPYLEKLVTELEQTLGAQHALVKKAFGELRSSYVLGGEKDKLKQLEQRFH